MDQNKVLLLINFCHINRAALQLDDSQASFKSKINEKGIDLKIIISRLFLYSLYIVLDKNAQDDEQVKNHHAGDYLPQLFDLLFLVDQDSFQSCFHLFTRFFCAHFI